ncbi:sugar kinase [Agromyces sp. NPDC058104]|uniref:sugar kinase n=1 Tax=Agromyces sp. NPDC058104 TaxID=3346342 RepID=UPI0036DDB437
MTRFDVTAIGEGGVRLSVPSGERLERAQSFDIAIAGTEANVLAGLSALGWSSSWCSSLPDSPLGRRVENELRMHGIDLSLVRRVPGARLGTYYVEYSVPPRPTQVTFDRANTAFALMRPDEVDWEALLDTRVLHLTGLTAALSPSVMSIVAEAFDRAADAGVEVSFDVNYRGNLWDPGTAAEALAPLIRRADILFCRAEDLGTLYGAGPDCDTAINDLLERTNARWVHVTDSERGIRSSIDGKIVSTPVVPVSVVDRLGAGDGFAAGALHGRLIGEPENAPRYGAVMAALALSQRGEQIYTTRAEVEGILADPAQRLAR